MLQTAYVICNIHFLSSVSSSVEGALDGVLLISGGWHGRGILWTCHMFQALGCATSLYIPYCFSAFPCKHTLPIHSTIRRYSFPLPTRSHTRTLLSFGLSADLCLPPPGPFSGLFCFSVWTHAPWNTLLGQPSRHTRASQSSGVFLLGIRYRYWVYWSGRSEKMGTKQRESGLLSSRLGFLAVSTKIHLLVSSCFDFGKAKTVTGLLDREGTRGGKILGGGGAEQAANRPGGKRGCPNTYIQMTSAGTDFKGSWADGNGAGL